MADFKRNKCWREAHQLTLLIYRTTRSFPREERFGLTSQLRRASVSVASNLAEGIGRGSSYAELDRFCSLAAGSLAEVEYQVILASELGYLSDRSVDEIGATITSCRKRLSGFRRWLAPRK